MKKTLLFISSLITLASISAQDCSPSSAYIELDANNIRAGLQLTGDLWWDGVSEARYIAPQNQPGEPSVSALFAGGLWMGARDPAGNLKVAISQYPTGNVTDYWPGPLNEQGEIGAESCTNWDRFFPVTRSQITQHLADYQADGVIDNPIADIFGWPARNNPFMSQYHGFDMPADRDLAPYVDSNGNGRYDPDQGEVPAMKGTQSIYWVFNDAGNIHLQSGGDKMQVDVQVLAYAEASDNEALNNTTFYDYKITNRGFDDLWNFYMGLWVNPDLGCFQDDYIGYDTTRNMAFVYNEDAEDGTVGSECPFGLNTYGTTIPMVGISPVAASFDYLKNSSFVVDQSDDNPPGGHIGSLPARYYNILNGIHADGTPLTLGGTGFNPGSTDTVRYIFTGVPSDPDGWSMCSEEPPFQDRRINLNTGGVDINMGESIEITYAVFFVEDVPHPCPSLDVLWEAYDEVTSDLPIATSTSEASLYDSKLAVVPNPSTGLFDIQLDGLKADLFVVTDLQGKVIVSKDALTSQIDITAFPAGVYMVTAYGAQQNIIATEKVVKTP